MTTDPKPPSRNCAGCNKPNPPHEMIDQWCLRCTHRELIDCRNALQIMTNAEDDARRELVRLRLRLDWLEATGTGLAQLLRDYLQHPGPEGSLVKRAMRDKLRETVDSLLSRSEEGAPTHEPNRPICPSCHNEIDPEVCWCGDSMKGHSYSEHYPVPMGCDCLRDRSTPPTPEPSRNTAGLHEPVWDSRNSDEPKTEVL